MNTLEQAIEPQGWISQAFEKVEEHLDEQDRKINHLEQNINYNKIGDSNWNNCLIIITKIFELRFNNYHVFDAPFATFLKYHL